MQRGADGVGELGLDQRLIDGLGGLADAVTAVGGLECVQDFEQGRLVQGHRVAPLYEFLWRESRRDSRGGPFYVLRHAVRTRTSTTSGDATASLARPTQRTVA